MISDIDKEKINIFVKNYFKSLRIKRFVILTLIFIISRYLTMGKEDIVFSIVVVTIVSFIMFFVIPDFLRSETERAIEKSYNKNSKDDEKVILICNLKKFDGPTFGTLHIDKESIEFNPFRENLQNERFLIEEKEMKNIQISLFKIKSSVFNRIFFKELYESISICCEGKKVLLQTPEPEKTIEKIKERIYEG